MDGETGTGTATTNRGSPRHGLGTGVDKRAVSYYIVGRGGAGRMKVVFIGGLQGPKDGMECRLQVACLQLTGFVWEASWTEWVSG